MRHRLSPRDTTLVKFLGATAGEDTPSSDAELPGFACAGCKAVATQPCILEFFDLARVEKFKRHWARGERLQGSHELARRRYRKVFQ